MWAMVKVLGWGEQVSTPSPSVRMSADLADPIATSSPLADLGEK